MQLRAEGHPPLGNEDAFTLTELLIAMLIIGILAAIAIPSFLSQGDKGYDASAKADVNRLVKLVESCKVEEDSYTQCDEPSEVDSGGEINWGSGEGTSAVALAGEKTYWAYSVSKAKTDGKNHIFAWRRNADGVTQRFCVNSALQPLNSGGCRSSGW